MARDFDGNGDYILATLNSSQINLTTISFFCWFYADSVAQYRKILHIGNSTRNYTVEMDDGWGMVCNFDWTGGGGAWSIPKPSTGAWHSYSYTYDNTSSSNDPVIWLDGVSQTVTERSTPSGTPKVAATECAIGSEYGFHGTIVDWDGRMAEWARWNRILTNGELIALHNYFSPGFFRRGLIQYYPLIGNNSPETDLVGGANGTVTNTTKIDHPRIIYPANSQTSFVAAAAAASTTYPTRMALLGVGM